MKILFLIPARGGSKGIPHKNIRDFCGKPLIRYSIDVARELADDADICVSTDDQEIIDVAEKAGLLVPFVRPEAYSTDTASSEAVMLHALDFYEKKGVRYDVIVLLQPTSPLRTAQQVNEAIGLFTAGTDMVIGVKKSSAAVTLMREEPDGTLVHAFDTSGGVRRQDAAALYEINGAVYVIDTRALTQKGMAGFSRIKKYVMPEISSADLDTEWDWVAAEALYGKQRAESEVGKR